MHRSRRFLLLHTRDIVSATDTCKDFFRRIVLCTKSLCSTPDSLGKSSYEQPPVKKPPHVWHKARKTS